MARKPDLPAFSRDCNPTALDSGSVLMFWLALRHSRTRHLRARSSIATPARWDLRLPIVVLAYFSALHVIRSSRSPADRVGALSAALCAGPALRPAPGPRRQDPLKKFELPRWTGHFRFRRPWALVLAIPRYFVEDHPCHLPCLPGGGIEGASRASSPGHRRSTDRLAEHLKLTLIAAFLGATLSSEGPGAGSCARWAQSSPR